MTVRIGIPQGLLYHEYGKLWGDFFRYLGMEVVLSGETNRTTLDYGSGLDEICLPAKVFFGHAYALRDKVDFVFASRIVSLASGQYTCPKMIAMPDLLRANISNLPPIIDTQINRKRGWGRIALAVPAVGERLGKSPWAVMMAWSRAVLNQRYEVNQQSSQRRRVAVVAHPYILEDRQISMNILGKLKQASITPITPSDVPVKQARVAAMALGKTIFWSPSQHLAGAAIKLMEGVNPVAGIIFLTCFSCGPDALIGELIRQHATARRIPCMNLSLDEHTSEAGFITRVEAFVDMLDRRLWQ